MSVGGGDEARGEVAAERNAVVALALASLENGDELREGLGEDIPTIEEALKELGKRSERGTRISQRTFVLQLLHKVASRRGRDFLEENLEGINAFLNGLVEEANRRPTIESDSAFEPDPPREPSTVRSGPVEELHEALVAASAVPAEPWNSFAERAQDTLSLTPQEISLPSCSDDETFKSASGVIATRTIVEFWSGEPASRFERWTDPRTWSECSLFFEEVTPLVDLDPTAVSFGPVLFKEVVRITTTKALVTELEFTRSPEAPYLFDVSFAMPTGTVTDDLLVDEGSITVREDEYAPANKRTKAVAVKALSFSDPVLKDWPTLLCDLFWMELTIIGALGCNQPPT